MSERPDDWKPRKRTRARTYESIIREFLDSPHAHARVAFDAEEYDARVVTSGLNNRIRDGRWSGVRVARRGDAVYLTREPRAQRPDARTILAAFAADKRTSVTVDTDGLDAHGVRALYDALHYRRRVEGYGWVRVSRTPDGGIALTDTLEG